MIGQGKCWASRCTLGVEKRDTNRSRAASSTERLLSIGRFLYVPSKSLQKLRRIDNDFIRVDTLTFLQFALKGV